MHVRSGDNPLQTPEQLDGRFKFVAGLYAAALLSPAVLGLATPWLGSVSWPVTLGLLGGSGSSPHRHRRMDSFPAKRVRCMT